LNCKLYTLQIIFYTETGECNCLTRQIHVNYMYFQFTAVKTRELSVECIPLPQHIEIGTVSLLASSSCMHVSEVD